MTNRYEDALNELKGYSYGLPDDLWETVISALKLAQEKEQLRLKLSETAIHLAARNSEIEHLRKERDELARGIIYCHEESDGDYEHLYKLSQKVVGE